MTKLLKKRFTWEWTNKCQKAFDELKTAMMKASVLALPDISKAFEVQIDASDFTLGGVLLQEGHLIMFESRKFSKVERCYIS